MNKDVNLNKEEKKRKGKKRRKKKLSQLLKFRTS